MPRSESPSRSPRRCTRDGGRGSWGDASIERLSSWRFCDNEIEIVHTDWARTGRREACGDEQVHDVLDSHVTVPVKMGQQPAALRATEVDCYYPTANLQD